MRSKKSILDEIRTEALDGPNVGSIDRATVAELIEAKNEFPHLHKEPQQSPDSKVGISDDEAEGTIPASVLDYTFPFPG